VHTVANCGRSCACACSVATAASQRRLGLCRCAYTCTALEFSHVPLAWQTKDDVFLAADSAKEASSWEKALIKGSMWHAENVHAAPVAAAPLSNRRTSLTAGRATVTTAPSSSGTFAKGLTAQQVHSVGTTFTFKSKKTALSSSNDDTDASSGGVGVLEFPPPLVTSAPGSLGGAGGAGGGGASMSSLVEQVSLRSAPVEAALGLRLVHLDMPGVRTQAFQSPFIAITSAATVNGKLMLVCPIPCLTVSHWPSRFRVLLTLAPPPPSLYSRAAALPPFPTPVTFAVAVFCRLYVCLQPSRIGVAGQ